MRDLKACIFDLDGVIVDTAKYHFIAWRRLANALGFDFTEKENEQLKGVSRTDSLNLILSWGKVSLTETEKTNWATKKNEWYKDFIQKMDASEILPGAKELLEACRAHGVKTALGSASKNARPILRQIGLIDHFDAIVDGTNVTKAKPDPEVFLSGAQQLGVEPKHAVVFEDAQKGVQAANTGGFYSVGIGSPDDLGAANWVVDGLHQVSLEDLTKRVSAQ